MPPTSEEEKRRMAEVLYPPTVPEHDIPSFPSTTSPWSQSSTVSNTEAHMTFNMDEEQEEENWPDLTLQSTQFTSGAATYSEPYMFSDRHGQQQYYSEPEPIQSDSRRRTPSYSAPAEAFFGSHITVPSQGSPSLSQGNVTQGPYSQNLYPSAMEPPLIPTPPMRNQFTPIAPDPAGIQRMHSRDHYEIGKGRRRRSTANSVEPNVPSSLRDDERFLLSLKDDQNLPWKEIANRFQTDLGQTHQVAALQMRYQRLKQRLRVWTETDTSALRQAHEYWENRKWEIISEKMLEFGAAEKFAPRACARKWQEINPMPEEFLGQFSYGPQSSRSTSPAPPPPVYPPTSYPSSTYWS